MEIALSFGSNLGDRLANLSRARHAIESLDGVTGLARSRVHETEPVDVRDEYAQIAFLNAVMVVSSSLSPAALGEKIHRIESEFGRVRTEDRNAPRPMDIDMIYAEGVVSETEELRLPHPRWHERRFVVQPLADIRPHLVLPGQTRSVAQILASLPASPGAILFTEEW